MNILICANWFPVCVANHFVKAFRQEGWQVTTLGPTYGHFIPWQGGMLLSEAARPDMPTAPEPSLPLESIAESIGQVDLVFCFEPHPMIVTGTVDVPSVCYAADPHVRKYFAEEYDHIFKAHSWGEGAVGNNVSWLPLGYDPEECTDLRQDRLFDVAFVGCIYEERKAAIEWLLMKGITLAIGWGPSGAEWNAIYNQAKMALCWSHSGDLSDRLLANMAQGCLCLVDRGVRDLEALGFRENLHYLAFGDMYELLEKARVGRDADFRAVVTERAKRQLEGHTWRDRVRQMVEEVGL